MSNNKLIQQGWECPKCGGVYSPLTNKCNVCPQSTTLGTSTSTSTTNSSTSLTHFCSGFEPSFQPSPKVASVEKVPCKKCGRYFHQHPAVSYTIENKIPRE